VLRARFLLPVRFLRLLPVVGAAARVAVAREYFHRGAPAAVAELDPKAQTDPDAHPPSWARAQ